MAEPPPGLPGGFDRGTSPELEVKVLLVPVVPMVVKAREGGKELLVHNGRCLFFGNCECLPKGT